MTAAAIPTETGSVSSALDSADAACWNRIGVYGNGSCPQLEQHVHCRNCPVYSEAALQLLDRPLPEDYRREWSAHFAREDEPGPPARSSALLFRIRLEWLGLPTQAFQEVAERKHIHPLPHRRQGTVVGLANIRGELLICVDLGRLLGLGSGVAQDLAQGYDRLLVVNWEGQRLVFPVDEVHGIHRFQARELKAPPATVAKSAASFSRGVLSWQQKSVGFLDAPNLFTALDRSLS